MTSSTVCNTQHKQILSKQIGKLTAFLKAMKFVDVSNYKSFYTINFLTIFFVTQYYT